MYNVAEMMCINVLDYINEPVNDYLMIDMRSFYASVECIERGLDPLTTELVALKHLFHPRFLLWFLNFHSWISPLPRTLARSGCSRSCNFTVGKYCSIAFLRYFAMFPFE